MRGAGFGVTGEERVNLDEVLERVRADVAARRRGVLHSAAPPLEIATLVVERVPLPRPADTVEPIPFRDEYALHELLTYSGPDFVRNAYRALLRREPEPGAIEARLGTLLRAEDSKFDLLSSLHESQEGRLANVRVRGLRLAILARKWAEVPLIGRALRLLQAMSAVSVAIENLERQEARLAARESALHDAIAQLAAATEASQAVMNARIARVNESIGVALRRLEREKASTGLAMSLTGGVAALHHEQAQIEAQLRESKSGANAVTHRLAEISATIARIDTEKANAKEAAARWQELEGLVTRLDASKADAKESAGRFQELASLVARIEANKADAKESAGRFQELASLAARIEANKADGKASEARFQEMASLVARVEASKADAAGTAEQLSKVMASGTENLSRMLQAVEKISEEKADKAEMEARFAEKMSKRNLEAVLAEDDHFLDDFYIAFEERARGTEADIKDRVRVYLPIVKKAGAGGKGAPILDVGCGRGEWLELLAEAKLEGRGIDINTAAVAHCREHGLRVEQGELLEYLQRLKPGSLGAITALHVIEHLTFPHRIAFLDAALKALRPGGIAIMETPNPENLNVGACNFWNDPTHLRPLPPEATKLIVELRGFSRVEILRLHPFPVEAHLPVDEQGTRDSLNHILFGPQDYSLLAYKE